jgi:hypothetical protein
VTSNLTHEEDIIDWMAQCLYAFEPKYENFYETGMMVWSPKTINWFDLAPIWREIFRARANEAWKAAKEKLPIDKYILYETTPRSR